MVKNYRAKISYGLLVSLSLILFGPLLINFSPKFNSIRLMGFLILLGTYAFILHMFLRTNYTIEHTRLRIKSGFFTYPVIEISQIKTIEKTSSIISSPAPSFDRIEIFYGKHNSIIISPKDKINFCKDLVDINPEIKVFIQ
jgi:hypothetical protein